MLSAVRSARSNRSSVAASSLFFFVIAGSLAGEDRALYPRDGQHSASYGPDDSAANRSAAA